MEYFNGLDNNELIKLQSELQEKLKKYQGMGLSLNMARGKPCKEQVDLSNGLLDGTLDFSIKSDYRNYGVLDGIDEAKEVFKDVLNVSKEELILGGNSSLNMMYDIIAKAMLLGTVDSDRAWSKYETIKFLCPVPGYDRHFSICEALGIEMINIDCNEYGPDMDMVEALVKDDDSIKGMWCVPKYANPTGITYSDDVVKRLARMETKAKDFRLMWDNAYIVHHLSKDQDQLADILDLCKEAGNNNRPYMFSSTSKVTFPGAGIAMLGTSIGNADFLRGQMAIQTIGSNKINQLMHAHFLPDLAAINKHMEKHAQIIGPKFEKVHEKLSSQLGEFGIATWNKPNGGYFISLEVLDGCAKEVVALCKESGVILTGAGATFPYKNDPKDSNIRIAPTFPPMDELEVAIDILCVCIQLVALDKML